MVRVEHQAKTRQWVSEERLIALGAELLGRGKSTDVYLRHPAWEKESWRIRIEGEKYVFAKKGRDKGRVVRVKEVSDEHEILRDEAHDLRHRHGELARVNFSYVLLKFRNAVISLDEVEILGCFLEVSSVDTEEEVLAIFEGLGLDPTQRIKESYLDLMLAEKLPRWERGLIRSREKITAATFGITSGVLTTVGALICEYGATSNRLAVAGVVVGIAVSDSWSDAYSMFRSKLAEGASVGVALRRGIATIAGKVLMPAILMIPLLMLPLAYAIYTNVAIGVVVLAVLGALQALATRECWWKQALGNVAIGGLIIALSLLGGYAVHKYFG